jgi:hypothetical protein
MNLFVGYYYCEISRSHGSEYEALLGCTAVLLIGGLPQINNTAVHPTRF